MNQSVENKKKIDLEPSWLEYLEPEFEQEYMKNLKLFLRDELKAHTVYPPASKMFSAFFQTPFDQVKVVILGQDPYHGPNQAHGLSFSVPEGVRIPPSLENIYKEIAESLGVTKPKSGNLDRWAQQGVFLLNACLTVRAHQANSHAGKGWEKFTDKVITTISEHKENVVFLLWGAYARKKKELINADKHLILEAPHPSPLSAHRGFFGCEHFKKANEFLASKELEPVNW
jgi:uracil-DNA glycosylase